MLTPISLQRMSVDPDLVAGATASALAFLGRPPAPRLLRTAERHWWGSTERPTFNPRASQFQRLRNDFTRR